MPAYSALSDNELLLHLSQGSEKAFTEIYNRYWERLLATAFHYTHNKQSAEDIFHEVLISLWNRRASLNIQSLPAYLGTAVKFAVFKTISREQRKKNLLDSMQPLPRTTDIEDKLEARFLQEYIEGKIAQLPEKARLVFNYSRKQELSISEIATSLDLSSKAVEYHMTKAIKSLRKSLQQIKSIFF